MLTINDLLSAPKTPYIFVNSGTDSAEDITSEQVVRVFACYFSPVNDDTLVLYNRLTIGTLAQQAFSIQAKAGLTRGFSLWPAGMLFDVGLTFTTLVGTVDDVVQIVYSLA